MIQSLHRKAGLLLVSLLLQQQIGLSQNIAYLRPVNAERSVPEQLVNAMKLKDVLVDLGHKYQVSIVFEESTVKEIFVKNSITATDKLERKLDLLLEPHGLAYRKTGKRTYVIVKKETEKISEISSIHRTDVLQMLRTATVAGNNPEVETLSDESVAERITGKVSDEKGAGLPGVSIVIKGTTRGTTTDTEGKFSLEMLDDNATLVFSFVGYATQEVIAGNRRNIDVKLLDDENPLSEVVVVGYSTIKKESLTGAVAAIKGKDLIKRTTSNVQQALQGQIPGLTVLDQGAGPGKSNMVLRIRGITTLGANEPLVIVDGIEQRLSDINPLDIESVSVLKDASSTAIYGSRAANGVILLTTKRAVSGKMSISYNGYYALQKTNNNPVHMGLGDYLQLQKVAWTNSTGTPGIFTDDYIKEYVNATDRLKYPLPNTWYDEVLRTAPQMNHSLSVSGGNENIKALLSVRYQNQQGIILANSDSKLSEIRLNTDYRLSSRLKFTTDVNYRSNNIIAPINENDVFNKMLQTSQWTVPRYPDGTYGISSDGHNPLLSAEKAGTAKTLDEYLLGNFKGELQILKGLTFTTQIGARINLTTGKNYANKYEVRDYYNASVVRKNVPINSLTETRNDVREYTFNHLLNYSTNIGKHAIHALLGYSQIENKGRFISAYRQGFYSNDVESIGSGTNDATKSNSGSEYTWGLRSYFGRVNYTFKDKYLFEANGRYDGSSRFLENNRYSFFPSVSAGWRISEEKFWGGLNHYVGELKLRGSWGKTGNQAVDLYSGLATLSSSVYSFSGLPAQTFQQTRIANQNLTWETTTQSNVGLDAAFLNNRLTLSLDYYNKTTDGILLTLPVPGTLGLLPAPQNAGAVTNKGWEFAVSTRNKFGGVGMDANFNFNVNNNNVGNLAGTGPYITGGNETRYITAEGYAINSFWGYKTDGLFQTPQEILDYPTMRTGVMPGDVKFVDLNNDGKITPADMTYLGRSFPKFTFGSSLNFSYKAFSLNMLFQGAAGAKARVGGAIIEMGIWGGFTHELIAGNYWTPENRDARFSRPLKYDLRNFVMSDRDLMNGSYLRLKNIQLVYQLPGSLTQKVGIKRASVYIATTNLLTFSALNEWNVDPETIPGGRTEQYPQTAVSTVGLNIQL
ncbi:SusC/RagA family TonB-linked outer membrane protein [Dyadobacter sp. LHD-138]|uniref:SusC/RagA family TonB-linked outer membrane protein n=1 Tax=Dyadobacter sp. LHD-138 TaxID=3071413 RepID=UPI0027E1E6B3|nr:SusC/RagA family TonB-linked outer membrane protein [Dyadobacter sp. LHD-138]MDQ6480600.1 SusC/RagA family TonB-linked outer membrane protein [Dyadobacter sp. LHD-138]